MNIKEKLNTFKTNTTDFINQKIQNIDTDSKKMIALQLIPMVNIVVRAVKEKQLQADLTSDNAQVKSLAKKRLKQVRVASYVGSSIHITATVVGAVALGILFPPSIAITAPICGFVVGGYAGAEWAIRNRSDIDKKAEKARKDHLENEQKIKEDILEKKECLDQAVGFKAKVKAYFS